MKTDTERAIEFLNDCQDDYEELQEEGNNKGILEVIRLLQCGEKFENMWRELDRRLGKHTLFYKNGMPQSTNYAMEQVKKEYFPKPNSEIIKLVQEIDRAVKEILEEVTK